MQDPVKLYRVLSLVSVLFISSQGTFYAAAQDTPPTLNALISPEHAQAIYQHLVEHHWVPRTGLFLSFLSTTDLKLCQQASTYDQAVIGLLALRLGDTERAKGVITFLKQAWVDGPLKLSPRLGVYGLTNFYNAEFGGEGIEKIIHVGPNAWVGLLAARLANHLKDPEALQFALEIAHWVEQDVPHRDGGVAMSPIDGADGIPWTKVYSTENNLSYYAFLTELLRSSSLDSEERSTLMQERNHVEHWLFHIAFDRRAFRVNRGFNPAGIDRVRALDTLTWFISALGPERIAAEGIDPDRLMAVAQEEFEVTVNGIVGVDPTNALEADRTSVLHEKGPSGEPPRPAEDKHRMIWYEGLGQYINALGVMATYATRQGRLEKALAYSAKAKQLADYFDRASLKQFPAGNAYPYATPGKLFHDGWWTATPSTQGPASALIAAAWRCFSGLGVDPVTGQDIAGVAHPINISLPQQAVVSRQHPGVLFGASEDMTIQAWRALDQKDYNKAITQAQATIQEWKPWADQLQTRKWQDVGTIVDDDGTPEARKKIFSYWALNDVGAAYFILGKALDQKKEYAKAAQTFHELTLHYSLAQVWDPQGWFWVPAEAVTNEFVSRDPRHYQGVVPSYLHLAQSSKQSTNPLPTFFYSRTF